MREMLIMLLLCLLCGLGCEQQNRREENYLTECYRIVRRREDRQWECHAHCKELDQRIIADMWEIYCVCSDGSKYALVD